MNGMGRPEAKRVLAFNSYKKLTAIYHSTFEAAKALNAHAQSIHYACNGVCIAVKKTYLRHLSDDIEITLEDLGTLRLEEYDELCGVSRKVYPNGKMGRNGLKYKSKNKNN